MTKKSYPTVHICFLANKLILAGIALGDWNKF